MTRQDFNQALLQTSFLYGANAPYIEELQAKYEKDPASVEPGWRDFFAALGDDPASVEKAAQGASWKNAQWPQSPKGDLMEIPLDVVREARLEFDWEEEKARRKAESVPEEQ